ncbi:MAG: gamma-glutamyltransferase [Ferruginibacter sp.]
MKEEQPTPSLLTCSRCGGLISHTDLKNYRAVGQAMNFPYRGYRVISMPLPSSGGLILAQLLGIMEQYKSWPAWVSTLPKACN